VAGSSLMLVQSVPRMTPKEADVGGSCCSYGDENANRAEYKSS